MLTVLSCGVALSAGVLAAFQKMEIWKTYLHPDCSVTSVMCLTNMTLTTVLYRQRLTLLPFPLPTSGEHQEEALTDLTVTTVKVSFSGLHLSKCFSYCSFF